MSYDINHELFSTPSATVETLAEAERGLLMLINRDGKHIESDELKKPLRLIQVAMAQAVLIDPEV